MELTVEIVKAARELISDRAHWVKGYYAASEKNPKTDRSLTRVSSDDPIATCFCSLGAIRRAAAAGGREDDVTSRFSELIVGCVPSVYTENFLGRPFANVAAFNDNPGTTHEQVLSAFDCLIAKMEGGK